MAPFPLPLAEFFGTGGAMIVYLIFGILFGVTLEMAGFGNSTRLAAQFYLKDMTVLKVMFTGIIVAMVLIFGASALGLLDYSMIWVNPTYLVPGIVGGLIMGFGFIIGGFCPGTSLVAAATLKLDGLFFSFGALFGIFLFGESVGFYDEFWHSTYMGRFTFQDMLGVDAGVVVLGIVIMAILVFFGAEQIEKLVGKQDPRKAPKWRYGAAGGLTMLAAGVMLLGQPTAADRWNVVSAEKQALLDQRAVQVHPGEVLKLMQNDKLVVRLIDVRSEADFNQFHLIDAENIPLDKLPGILPDLQLATTTAENIVIILMSNDETAATEAWKRLQADSIPNTYILEGGINGWLKTFAADLSPAAKPIDDQLAYVFTSALGSRSLVANPNPDAFALEYTEKVVLKLRRGPAGGGCG